MPHQELSVRTGWLSPGLSMWICIRGRGIKLVMSITWLDTTRIYVLVVIWTMMMVVMLLALRFA